MFIVQSPSYVWRLVPLRNFSAAKILTFRRTVPAALKLNISVHTVYLLGLEDSYNRQHCLPKQR